MNIKVEDVLKGDLIRATSKEDPTLVIQFTVTEQQEAGCYYGEGVSCPVLDVWIRDAEYNLELIKRPVKVPTKPFAVVAHKEYPEMYITHVLEPTGSGLGWMKLGYAPRETEEHVKQLLETGDYEVVFEGIER